MTPLFALALLAREALLGLAAFALNLPCGAWRVRVPKRSIVWFVSIHAPIPIAFLLRQWLDLSIWFVIVSLLFAVAGQLLGGRLWAPTVDGVDRD